MEENLDQQININSEIIANNVSKILSKNNERYINQSFVYQAVKSYVKDESIIDEVFRATINLLEYKYGILFDVDKKVKI